MEDRCTTEREERDLIETCDRLRPALWDLDPKPPQRGPRSPNPGTGIWGLTRSSAPPSEYFALFSFRTKFGTYITRETLGKRAPRRSDQASASQALVSAPL